MTPLPANAVLRAFKLQYVKPEEIGQALHNITGGGGPRIAIDERTNALLIAGEDKQMGVVQQVIETLDQPAGQKGKGNDTCKCALSGCLMPARTKASRPNRRMSSAASGRWVARARIRIATRDVSAGDDAHVRSRTRGPISVSDPGACRRQSRGNLTVTARLRLPTMTVTRSNSRWVCSSRTTPNDCQVGGSILTPLGHYTVMGTSTFVVAKPGEEKKSDTAESLESASVGVCHLLGQSARVW